MSNCEKPDTNAINFIPNDNVPVWGKSYIPDATYLRASIRQYNPQLSAEELNTFNLPIQDVIGSLTAGDATVQKNGTDIKELSNRQVYPAYVSRNEPHAVLASDKDHHAKFLVVGVDPNDENAFMIKGSGTYVFAEGHDYIVGADYYLDDKGNVSTDATDHQHLFYAVNNRTILINLGD